ncbi:glycosyltransferase family 2 protein [Gloeobacter kilaueensis]|uniref:Glycosyl transferase family 2 n=1 Tax=Gloeobacter kilaueensis (strain ATCC BAA-2537 / CCAP 1431/1 / ULC 316 / JS1) TaxID=1183438 RepID=U5QMW2_GLOK1|nr:glycosyltransferase family A protein [Gloeobacter kilaueensis]AGY60243.1 glycosyl transferase family 2 [Gloeobacter kilaueensis JS1]
MYLTAKDREDAPLVSVVIPAYNAGRFIAATLESVLAQTYSHLEVLVVDDGSSDQTAEIALAFAARDQRVIVVSQANAGVAAARNLGIERSRGAFIALVDADDIWYPDKLSLQVQCFEQSGAAVGLVYTWSAHIDAEGKLTGGYIAFKEEGDVYLPLLYRNFVGNGSTPLIRAGCLRRTGGFAAEFRERRAGGCEDWDLYLRLAEVCEFRVVPQLLTGYRQLPASMSANYEAMERSFALVIERACQRRPALPALVSRWAASDVCCYLANLARQNGHHRASFTWALKSMGLDPAALLRFELYRDLIEGALLPLVGPDRHPLQHLRHRWRTDRFEMADVERRIAHHNRRLWPHYERHRLRRLVGASPSANSLNAGVSV